MIFAMPVAAALVALAAQPTAEPHRPQSAVRSVADRPASIVHSILGWTFTPLIANDGLTITGFIGELDPAVRTGDNLHLIYLAPGKTRNDWTTAAWRPEVERPEAFAWVAARHGAAALQLRDDDRLGAVAPAHTDDPASPVALRDAFLADDPVLADIADQLRDAEAMSKLAQTGHPVAPGIALLNARILKVRDITPSGDASREQLSMLGDNITLDTPIELYMLANHMHATMTDILKGDTTAALPD